MNPIILIPNLLIAQILIGCFCCLGRTDYTVVFGLFAYYLWTMDEGDKEKTNIYKLIIVQLCLIGLDIIWLVLIGFGWGRAAKKDEMLFDKQKPMHHIVILFVILNIVVKGVAAYFLNLLAETVGLRGGAQPIQGGRKQQRPMPPGF